MTDYAGVIEYIQLSLQNKLVLGTLDVPTSEIVFTSPGIAASGDVTLNLPVKEIKVNVPGISLSFFNLIITPSVKSAYFNSPALDIENYDGNVRLPVAEIHFNSLPVSQFTLDERVVIPNSSFAFNGQDVSFDDNYYKVIVTVPVSPFSSNSPDISFDDNYYKVIINASISSVDFNSPDISFDDNYYKITITAPESPIHFNSLLVSQLALDELVITPIGSFSVNSPTISFDDYYKSTIPVSVTPFAFDSENVNQAVFSQPVINFGTVLFIPISGIVFNSLDINLFSFSEVTVTTRMISNQFKYLVGIGEIDFSSDTFKIALMASGFSFDQDNHGEWADISGNEISSSGGYTPGGYELSIDAAWQQDNTNDQGIISWENHTFTPTGGSFDLTSSAVIYDSSHSSDIVVGAIQFDSNISVVEGTVLELQSLGFNNI